MVKKISSSLAAANAVSLKALDRIFALEAEVSRLRHQLSLLSKRLHKLDPPRRKVSCADSSSSPDIVKDILWLDSAGKAVEKEGLAEELPPGIGTGGSVAGVGAKGEAMEEGLASPVDVTESEAERMSVASVELVEEPRQGVAMVRLPGGKKWKVEEGLGGRVVRLEGGGELVRVPTRPRRYSQGVSGVGGRREYGDRGNTFAGPAGRGIQ